MGSGYKDFVAGNVLTEADLDGYLMRQTVMTFASTAARDSALSGVLDEGMVAYLEDTNRTTKYDGANWIVTESPWAAYTPTMTNASNGNGTLTFRYRYAGWKTVQVRGSWVLGSTSSVSGLIGFGLPDSVTGDTTVPNLGTAWLIDDTGTDQATTCNAGSSLISVYADNVVSTNATSPFTWATSDAIRLSVTFEIT
jgi:hypothetical protein